MDGSEWSQMGIGPSPEVEEVLNVALVHVEGGEWELAMEMLADALERLSADPYLLCWLGLAERELGLDGPAYEHFRMALAEGPQDPVLLSTLGNALASADDPAAGEALRTAALLAPELAQARWMYGAYLSREGLFAEALEELHAALRLDPEDSLIQVEEGVARALSGDLEGGATAFARALEMEPEDGWVLLLLGLTRFELGDLEEAVGSLEEGARLRPEDVEAQLLTALALRASGLEDRAEEMLERARLGAEGGDRSLIDEIEERFEEGEEAALALLREGFASTALRERLLQRP